MTKLKNILLSAIIIYFTVFVSACGLVRFAPDESTQDIPGSAINSSAVASKSPDSVSEDSVAGLGGDADHDGVINSKDNCAETPAGAWVDVRGCPLDTDGDKVADYRDACGGTPRGINVDNHGCGFDDDNDGVPNHRDNCANTVDSVSVNGSGCEWDGDNDGVVDRKDLCVGTPPGVVVEPMGCLLLEVVTLKGVHFKTGSDELGKNARAILSGVAQTLLNHPRMRVEIGGHTDNTGSAQLNHQLSAKRARVTKHFLIGLGVNEQILAEKAYADEQPISGNDTQEGRSLNRRVEMRIVEVD